jgi:hypothetical protein
VCFNIKVGQEKYTTFMARYTFKPIEVDGVLWTGDEHQTEDSEWLAEAIADGTVIVHDEEPPGVSLNVMTPLGWRSVSRGDYVYRNVESGTLYVSTAGKFNELFVKVKLVDSIAPDSMLIVGCVPPKEIPSTYGGGGDW